MIPRELKKVCQKNLKVNVKFAIFFIVKNQTPPVLKKRVLKEYLGTIKGKIIRFLFKVFLKYILLILPLLLDMGRERVSFYIKWPYLKSLAILPPTKKILKKKTTKKQKKTDLKRLAKLSDYIYKSYYTINQTTIQ